MGIEQDCRQNFTYYYYLLFLLFIMIFLPSVGFDIFQPYEEAEL